MNLSGIKDRIAQLDVDPGWYQDIDLKNGVRTKKRKVWGEDIDHPRRRWAAMESGFPSSFEGKSVLDVGCNAGFFSFVAAERDADYVCGIDYNGKYIDQAKFCNEVRGDKVDFRICDTLEIRQLGRKFDVTICIGLLYHVPNLWGAIKAIGDVTTEMAIVESAILNDRDQAPLVEFVGRDKKRPGTWHPNILALRHMFEHAGFTRTEPAFKDGGRGGIIAYK